MGSFELGKKNKRKRTVLYKEDCKIWTQGKFNYASMFKFVSRNHKD